uniref:Uncharacterized protein n=1 Tax=Macrostomum lignano TaxID=282301 RepID=A0A1I8GEZ9_9PLAT
MFRRRCRCPGFWDYCRRCDRIKSLLLLRPAAATVTNSFAK